MNPKMLQEYQQNSVKIQLVKQCQCLCMTWFFIHGEPTTNCELKFLLNTVIFLKRGFSDFGDLSEVGPHLA